MNRDKILDYIMTTPYNVNWNVLSSMLGDGDWSKLKAYVEITPYNMNRMVLESLLSGKDTVIKYMRFGGSTNTNAFSSNSDFQTPKEAWDYCMEHVIDERVPRDVIDIEDIGIDNFDVTEGNYNSLSNYITWDIDGNYEVKLTENSVAIYSID